MIQIRFEEREKIGLQYILESLHGCSPFGQERIRRLRFYTPDERPALETELYNVQALAVHNEELKDTFTRLMTLLCLCKAGLGAVFCPTSILDVAEDLSRDLVRIRLSDAARYDISLGRPANAEPWIPAQLFEDILGALFEDSGAASAPR